MDWDEFISWFEFFDYQESLKEEASRRPAWVTKEMLSWFDDGN